MTSGCELRLTSTQWAYLSDHLFPGDGQEHGAVVLAGVAEASAGMKLIAREILVAADGSDYTISPEGYWRLSAEFIADAVGRAASSDLAYVAVHCHGGHSFVALSGQDRRSHARTYPALLDIVDGAPVVGAVFATGAAAGDVWLPDRAVRTLERVVVTGDDRRVLTPTRAISAPAVDGQFGRQALMFGQRGQEVLGGLTVAVIGCGGIGSLLVEFLARLGVGHIIVIDDDRVDVTNLPRLTGSRGVDAMEWFARIGRPDWLRRLGRRLARRKVDVAARGARRANRRCQVTRIYGDVAITEVAMQLRHVDHLFLAADTYRARLVVNALAFQYGIPGTQLGAKVRTRSSDGSVIDVYSVVRPFGPEHGCLMCNGLIPPDKLCDEALSERQREAQRYIDDDSVAAPSVITLNAVAAAHAADEFMFHMTGLPRLEDGGAHHYVTYRTMNSEVERMTPRRDASCLECGDVDRSRRSCGDSVALPTTDR